MNATSPTTLQEIVADIIESMSEADKANVVNTKEEDLIQFHHGWGTGIRNYYNLWHNRELLKATGKEHPDDASMVIIKNVWQALQNSGETYLKGKIETDTLQWHEVEKCLEIKAGGRSIVIYGLDSESAKEIADAMRMSFFSSESYSIPEVTTRAR